MEEVRACLDIVILMISERTLPAELRDEVIALGWWTEGTATPGLVLRLTISLLGGRLASVSIVCIG